MAFQKILNILSSYLLSSITIAEDGIATIIPIIERDTFCFTILELFEIVGNETINLLCRSFTSDAIRLENGKSICNAAQLIIIDCFGVRTFYSLIILCGNLIEIFFCNLFSR